MNLRSELINLCMEVIASETSVALTTLEIGCMFRMEEGTSTLQIANAIHERGKGGQLFSLEYDQSHIDVCKEILSRESPNLLEIIDFRHGHSLTSLAELLPQVDQLDFCFLDGGAHPEVCLHEFELCIDKLSASGIILIDDVQALAPSENYPLPRDFGKGTLIWPYLIIQQYLANRQKYRHANSIAGEESSVPDSPFVNHNTLNGPSGDWSYHVFGDTHKVLAFGPAHLITRVVSNFKNLSKEGGLRAFWGTQKLAIKYLLGYKS